MARLKSKSRLTVGWREWIALPGLGIPAIRAKVDTGARTSALHAENLELFWKEEQMWTRFEVRPARSAKIRLECITPIVGRREITDSGGHKEMRYVIRSTVQIGEKTWPIEITLTERSEMRFGFLLGRTAIAKRVVVDPGKSFVLGKEMSAAYKKLTTGKGAQKKK